jgi:hypothetical protein
MKSQNMTQDEGTSFLLPSASWGEVSTSGDYSLIKKNFHAYLSPASCKLYTHQLTVNAAHSERAGHMIHNSPSKCYCLHAVAAHSWRTTRRLQDDTTLNQEAHIHTLLYEYTSRNSYEKASITTIKILLTVLIHVWSVLKSIWSIETHNHVLNNTCWNVLQVPHAINHTHQ